MKKKTTPKLPPQPSGHDLNVGDLVYVAMAGKFARVTHKVYRFDPRRRNHVRYETTEPRDFSSRTHRRTNDLLTVQSVEGAFDNGSNAGCFDSFHCHLADASFRGHFFAAAVNALNERHRNVEKHG
jgi:hypothetical protein